jgi:hypothetical protein
MKEGTKNRLLQIKKKKVKRKFGRTKKIVSCSYQIIPLFFIGFKIMADFVCSINSRIFYQIIIEKKVLYGNLKLS